MNDAAVIKGVQTSLRWVPLMSFRISCLLYLWHFKSLDKEAEVWRQRCGTATPFSKAGDREELLGNWPSRRQWTPQQKHLKQRTQLLSFNLGSQGQSFGSCLPSHTEYVTSNEPHWDRSNRKLLKCFQTVLPHSRIILFSLFSSAMETAGFFTSSSCSTVLLDSLQPN